MRTTIDQDARAEREQVGPRGVLEPRPGRRHPSLRGIAAPGSARDQHDPFPRAHAAASPRRDADGPPGRDPRRLDVEHHRDHRPHGGEGPRRARPRARRPAHRPRPVHRGRPRPHRRGRAREERDHRQRDQPARSGAARPPDASPRPTSARRSPTPWPTTRATTHSPSAATPTGPSSGPATSAIRASNLHGSPTPTPQSRDTIDVAPAQPTLPVARYEPALKEG